MFWGMEMILYPANYFEVFLRKALIFSRFNGNNGYSGLPEQQKRRDLFCGLDNLRYLCHVNSRGMMKYPIGIQAFEKLRKEGYVYVDKTALVYQLVQQGTCYFLSRPRRFGKSLLVSTMEAYFLGKKELFEGLAMEQLETEWKAYPVLRLDLNAREYVDEASLKVELNKHLVIWEKVYGAPSDQSLAPEERFYNLVLRIYEQTHEQVVFLVDEYDKPLLQAVDKPELQEAYRNTLKAFYTVLKSLDEYFRFAFLTGVTKFSHVSVFSDLNNLEDISMQAAYVDVCGISEEELHTYFDTSIHELATANNKTYEETCEQLRKQYDGYHFRQDSVGIYNPFSLLNTFKTKDFQDYWFKTGTPTFLVKLLQKNDYDLDELEGQVASIDTLNSVYTETTSPVAILYQSGYLTIKDYDAEDDVYILGFPNQEVERGFARALVPYYIGIKDQNRDAFFIQFAKDVRQGRPEDFMLRLQTMLASNDYRVAGDKELYFQNTVKLIFWMLGFKVEVERATSNGRIDITIKTKDYVYVLELKLDGTAEDALQQIKDKQYARPFQLDNRKLYMIGVNFSSSTRTVEKWIIE